MTAHTKKPRTFQWSVGSRLRLYTCDPKLVTLFNMVLEEFDCTVLCGARDEAAQFEAFRTGHSRLEWTLSPHNCESHRYSRAVDVAPYPIDWNDRDRFMHFAGIVRGVSIGLGIAIRWGGNFDGGDLEQQPWDDLVHYELKS